VHDSDADGACSAIVFAKYLEDRKIEVVLMESSDPLIHSNTKKEIRKEKAGSLIVLDLGSEAYDSLKELSEEMHVMVLDHHKVVGSPDFGKTLILNPHLFNIPDNVVGPTSYLSYVICQELDWVAAIGTIADKGFYPAEELLKSVKKRYKVDFERLSQMFEAGAVLRKLAETRDEVRNAESPEELEKSETLISFEKEYLQELERLKKLHESDAEELADGRILLFDFTSEYRVRGMVSNMLQSMYPEKSIIVAEKVGQHYYFSMRAGGQNVDLVEIIKYAIDGLAEANGGGHTKAAGARVMAGDRDKFISGFVEKFKEI
jgi:single-stranded DNA-specific DHH superfamily exonuclease